MNEQAWASPPGWGSAGSFSGRLRLWGFSIVYVFLAVPALFLLVTMTTALSVAVLGVGMLLMMLLVPLNQQLANIHRSLSGRMLGRTIESSYASSRSTSPWKSLLAWSRDPSRWRDFAWTYMSVCIGWALSWIAFGLGLAVVWYAIFPFIFAVTPDGVFDVHYGIFILDTQAESFLEWLYLLFVGPLAWKGIPLLMRWRAELDQALLAPSRAQLEARVDAVSKSRADTLDHSAAEIRRIERDLHDGAQVRLASLGMSLGLAEQMLQDDPEGARQLINEARTSATAALGDIRSVVRGIHPPVLADRGLAGAIQALALETTVPISVFVELPGWPPAPVESAAYFAVSECLSNVVKHARATRGSIELFYEGQRLHIVIRDDGIGGAAVAAGGGLAGLVQRLEAFDGTMEVDSPTGGPTIIRLEIPCALSSPKTMPSSATD